MANKTDKIKLKNYQIQSIQNQTQDYVAALAVRTADKEKVFIKIPISEDGKGAINREYNNQRLFLELAERKDCGFSFLPITMDEELLVVPDVSDKIIWLGEPRSKTKINPKNESIEAYLGNYLKLQRVMREIKFNELLQPIKDDWRLRKNKYLKKFKTNSSYLLEKRLIAKTFIGEALDLLGNFGDSWAFQHHDIVPWHIGRRKDRKLLLIDTGWAGWSFKYYDFAYTALQLIGYADRSEDARILLARARTEYGDDIDFEPTLKTALFYRVIRLAKELH